MFNGILWEHREESDSGGLHRKRRHLNWTFREWTRILQFWWELLSEKSQEDRALGTVRVEGALWGSMIQGPYPSCFVTGMPSYPFTVFFLYCSMNSSSSITATSICNDARYRQWENLVFIAWFPCLWLPPPFALPFSKQHHMLCLCAIYWARTRLQGVWAMPLQIPLKPFLTDLNWWPGTEAAFGPFPFLHRFSGFLRYSVLPGFWSVFFFPLV